VFPSPAIDDTRVAETVTCVDEDVDENLIVALAGPVLPQRVLICRTTVRADDGMEADVNKALPPVAPAFVPDVSFTTET
jgi:hypothetical protein